MRGARLSVAAVGVLATGLFMLSAGASQAAAAIWFAAPDGDGADPCLQADPCDIYDAVGNAPAGTRIAAAAGTYEIGTVLQVQDEVLLQGPYSGPPAVLLGDGSSGPAVSATGDGTRITDLAIRQNSFGNGVLIGDGAIGDRLDSSTSGAGAACTPLFGGLLRDSVCSATGAGGNGVAIDGISPGSGGIELTNLTATSAGDDGSAAAVLVRAQGGAQLEVDGSNVIAEALGDAPDIAIGALAGPSSADFTLSHSNFHSVFDFGVDTSVTPTDSNGNQSADPVFADAAFGDFSEAVGSPTIDAGSPDVASLGLLDIVRRARIGNGAPDIGAYEFVPPPDTRTPNVSIPVAPKGRIRTTSRFVDLTFELASDEPGVVFECKINRQPAETCTSPATFRLEATKGVGTTYTLVVRATDAAGNRSGKAIRQVQLIREKL